MTRFFLILLLVWSAALVWAQTEAASILRPGDVVRLTCEEEPSLNKEYTITRDGLLVLSFIGAIPVAGLTEQEAAQKVAAELIEQRIVQTATVTLKRQGASEQQAPIRVSGAVESPGEVPGREGLRLSDVLKIARPTSSADLSRVEVTTAQDEKLRFNFSLVTPTDDSQNPLLRPGDRVFLPIVELRQEVLVLGGVQRPGAYPLESEATLAMMIEKAGGISSLGDSTRIRIERTGRAAQLINLQAVPPDFLLMAGDRIVVELRAARDYVYLTGAVVRNGGFDLVPGMTLNRLIQDAGGLLRGGRMDRMTIQRTEGGRVRTITVNLEDVRKGLAADPILMANDRIHVPTNSGRRNNAAVVAGAAVLLYLLFGR